MNGTHQVLAYLDYVYLMCNRIRARESVGVTLLHAFKDISIGEKLSAWRWDFIRSWWQLSMSQ